MAIHVTFRTSDFAQAESLLRRSVSRNGVELHCYLPDHPAVEYARSENPSIMAAARGAGYWLWKPYIILDALRSAPEGTVVLYTDVAFTYIADPAPLFSMAGIDDVVLFENAPQNFQDKWTKRDAFVKLDADRPEYHYRRQLDAGIQLYRSGPKAIAFLEATKTAMQDPAVLTDQPNICGLPNLDGFVEHRHDQSVLTIMAQKWGVPTFRSPSLLPEAEGSNGAEGAYGKIFHQHRQRDVPSAQYFYSWLTGVYDGRWLRLPPHRYPRAIAKRILRNGLRWPGLPQRLQSPG
jgi:hypothetical protein